jgi:phosphoglycerate dehydrogenase-like enzyme
MSEAIDTLQHALVVPIEGSIFVPEGMVRDPASILPDEVVEYTAQRYDLHHKRGCDLMCGVGTIPRVITRLGGICNAWEIDPEQQRVANETLGGRLWVGLGDALKYSAEERYDYIYTSVPFSWFKPGAEPSAQLGRAFWRTLKPGGILIIDSDDFTVRGDQAWSLANRQIEYFERHGFQFDESVRYITTGESAGDSTFTELKFTRVEDTRPQAIVGDVLVTGELFILPDDEEQLRRRGLGVVRLQSADPNCPTEDELEAAVPGKVGYLLGGNERVTERVLRVADRLGAIVFCGSDYAHFVPAWRYAREQDIAVEGVPDGHAKAVAEWCQAVALAMNRGFFGGSGQTAIGLDAQSLGIVGMGQIGGRLAGMVRSNSGLPTLYYNRHVVFLCVSSAAGQGYFGAEQIDAMKPGALLVSCMVPGVVDEAALLRSLQRPDGIRAVSDYPMQDVAFQQLPPGRWWNGTGEAFNTQAGVRETSRKATERLIRLLAASGVIPRGRT